MADYNDILAALHEHYPDIAAALDDGQLAALDTRRSALAQRSMDIDEDADAEARLTADVLSLVAAYPAVEEILRRQSPGVFPPSAIEPVIPQTRPAPRSRNH